MSRGFRFIQDMQIVCLCFYDPVEKAAALAHSGWRGTVGRIGAKMVQFLENEYGSKRKISSQPLDHQSAEVATRLVKMLQMSLKRTDRT